MIVYPRTLVTAPAAEPITTTEAKSHLRVTSSDDDTYIGELITVAREYVEEITNRALVTQTWDFFLDSFPSVITTPKGTLQSVTSITYTDADGNTGQTVSTSVYTVDTDSDPGRIYLAYSQTWPVVRAIRNAITIRIVSGYGGASSVPYPLKQAMYLVIAHLYENREAIAPALSELPLGFRTLIAPYRVYYH